LCCDILFEGFHTGIHREILVLEYTIRQLTEYPTEHYAHEDQEMPDVLFVINIVDIFPVVMKELSDKEYDCYMREGDSYVYALNLKKPT
jgi:hypothetical protein